MLSQWWMILWQLVITAKLVEAPMAGLKEALNLKEMSSLKKAK